jgi:hypothetical protein
VQVRLVIYVLTSAEIFVVQKRGENVCPK